MYCVCARRVPGCQSFHGVVVSGLEVVVSGLVVVEPGLEVVEPGLGLLEVSAQ